MNVRVPTLALFLLTPVAVAWADSPQMQRGPVNRRGPAGPAKYSETAALHAELAQSKTTLLALAGRTERTLTATRSARAKVKQVATLIRNLGQLDDLLVRVIRQLKPLTKLPPTRSLGPVVANLTKLQGMVHPVRVKGDAVQKKIITPVDNKLKSLEAKLVATITGIKQSVKETDAARAHVDTLRGFVESRGHNRAEVTALETFAKGARATLKPLKNGINTLDEASAAVERDLNDLAKNLTALADMGPPLAHLQKDLKPVNDTARDLDKVLNQKIAVEVLGQKIGFTVRQVIEGPGDVADAILQPLEKLANDALQPVVKALKLEIQPPRELTAIADQLDNVRDNVTPSVTAIETALNGTGLAAYQSALGQLRAKTAGQLTAGR